MSLQRTILNLMKMLESSQKRHVETIVGIVEISHYEQILPSSLSKDLYCRHVKTRDCLGILVASVFSLSHNVFYPLPVCLPSYSYRYQVLISYQKVSSFNNFRMQGEEEILVASIFSLSHNVFYQAKNKFQTFSHIFFVICRCFQFGPV